MPLKAKLRRFINRLRGKPGTLEEIEEILERAHARSILPSYTYALLQQILKIADKTVEEVMVPRVDMVTVRENMAAKEVIEVYKKHGFSKMPILRDSGEGVMGILYIKELLKNIGRIDGLKARDLAIRPYYIPDTKKVLDALRELQRRRVSIALVVDEFGSVLGLVTLEDLLEEIVGEIFEEFDVEEVQYRPLEDGSYLFNTRIELEEASKILGIELESEDVHTLAGYLMEKLERVPQKGEKFEINGISFEVVDGTQQRVKRVKAKVLDQAREEKAEKR
jgi:CBS domain containing-hemolysin-like protein